MVLGELARDAEHGAVAAHHDRVAALLADLGHRHGLDARDAQVGRGFGLEHDAVAFPGQEIRELPGRLFDAESVLPHYERDDFLLFRRH
ncbi:hypothetical protein D9M71_839920 [compost metagenome]